MEEGTKLIIIGLGLLVFALVAFLALNKVEGKLLETKYFECGGWCNSDLFGSSCISEVRAIPEDYSSCCCSIKFSRWWEN